LNLSELLLELQEGQYAIAKYGKDHWFVKKTKGNIRYCNSIGTYHKTCVTLTKSIINAEYKIIGSCE
jgi:hypothetical protein